MSSSVWRGRRGFKGHFVRKANYTPVYLKYITRDESLFQSPWRSGVIDMAFLLMSLSFTAVCARLRSNPAACADNWISTPTRAARLSLITPRLYALIALMLPAFASLCYLINIRLLQPRNLFFYKAFTLYFLSYDDSKFVKLKQILCPFN